MRGGIVRQFLNRCIVPRGNDGIDAQGIDRQCIEVRTLKQFGVDGQLLRRLIARCLLGNLVGRGFNGLGTHDRRNGLGLFHGSRYVRRVDFPGRLQYGRRGHVRGVGMIVANDGSGRRFLESLQDSAATVGKSRGRQR